MNKERIAGLDNYALEVMNCNKDKILKAVEGCIKEMGDLTIDESKIAIKHLDCVLKKMYMRSPDTVIGTIQR